MSHLRASRALFIAVLSLSLVAGSIIAPAPAAAQTDAADEDAIDAELIGYEPAVEPLADEDWVNPVVQFNLDPAQLAPLPEYNVEELHDSTVFAAGVDRVEVIDQDLEPYILRHRQVLQAIDTLDGLISENAASIARRRPDVQTLNDAIEVEHQNEARLADEISLHKRAIAEYAVRAFIGEDELDTAALIDDSTPLSTQRIITDEVRDDQLRQIALREAEIERRENRRTGLETDLGSLRAELADLREERTVLIDNRRQANAILPHTAAAYQVALHERLPEFVDQTDIPLVALNAYVLAERNLAEERPQCSIEWWMLAGIGRIESFHGHFGNSTLNANGHTTEAIRGPALDGRILSGAEFLEDGAEAPEATGRTEDQPVTTVPPAAPPAEAAPAEAAPAPPAALTAAEPTDASTGDGEGGTEGSAGPNDGSPPAPQPVIRRLALIRDTDGGRLDQDTVFDRAVGPMQFIPQTWNLFDSDGNADGRNDPQNIYDASLAAARYLCASTKTMSTVVGRQQAYFAYNHDTEYTAAVESRGQGYRDLIDVPDDEFGTTRPLGISEIETESIIQALENLSRLAGSTLLDW